MTEKWNPKATSQSPFRLAPDDETPLIERFAATPVVVKLLEQRGITTPQEARAFFSPSLQQLHDPFLLPGMDAAVARLNEAMGNKEKILVYGDYDVDGTTAVALVYKYLSQYYSQMDYYIPGRYDDGYGISNHVVDEAAASGVKLIIILDCGIKAIEEIAYAKSLGIDFIICDHHVAGEQLPDAAAILNPKLEGSTYPFSHLSGCGVGFKFMQAFAQSNGLPEGPLDALMDLVAVSIAADIVSMTDENRVLTYHGLRRLNQNPNMGLRSIMNVCGLSIRDVSISDVIFKIGPRINASGRMQSGKEAVDLLTAHDSDQAKVIAEAIDSYNTERKELDKQITDEAIQLLRERGDFRSHKKSLVIYSETWHRGIIGIVASRLTEDYHKPAVVMTLTNGIASGSARSVQGFDIYSAVESCADLLENFGGHTYAVGLSMKPENVEEFSRRFEQYVAENITREQLHPVSDISADISLAEANNDLLRALRRFNPFGPGNPIPVFRTRGVLDAGTSRTVGRALEHIKLDLIAPGMEHPVCAIAFNQSEHFERIHAGEPFTITYTLEENRHHAATSLLQLMVKEITFD